MKRVAIVASGLGFGLMATDGWFHVPEDHAGILFSSVVGVIPRSFESGYHLKTPVVAKNIANIFLGSDEKEVTPIKIVAKDGKSMEASFRITSTMSSEKVVENYNLMGQDMRNLVIVSSVNHAWANETKNRTSVQIKESLPEIEKAMIDGAAQYGVQIAFVETLSIKNLN